MKKLIVVIAAGMMFTGVAVAEEFTVKVSSAVMRSAPNAVAGSVAKLKKGQVVEGVVEGTWVKSKLSGGKEGYVYGALLGVVAKDTQVVAEAPVKTGVALPVSHDIKPSTAGDLALASPATTNLISRERLRKEPLGNGLIYRYLDNGEEVKVLGAMNGWVRVETKWKFDSGKPMVGYVSASGFSPDIIEKLGLPAAPKDDAKNVVLHPGAPQRVVQIGLPKPNFTEEIGKLKEEAGQCNTQLSALRTALAGVEARFREADVEKTKLRGELKTANAAVASVQAQLQAIAGGGKGKLVALADKGEAVFFKGLGEALMSSVDGKTVLRFPLDAVAKADKTFAGAKAERYLQGVYAYYVVDSSLLAF